MKVRITIKETRVTTVEVGNMPPNLIRDVLMKNDGTFDGNWSVYDLRGDQSDAIDSIEVEEVK